MIPTIYPTIFLQLEFYDSTDISKFNIIKYYKVGPNLCKGALVSADEANWLFAEPLNLDGIIAKYYPELLI